MGPTTRCVRSDRTASRQPDCRERGSVFDSHRGSSAPGLPHHFLSSPNPARAFPLVFSRRNSSAFTPLIFCALTAEGASHHPLKTPPVVLPSNVTTTKNPKRPRLTAPPFCNTQVLARMLLPQFNFLQGLCVGPAYLFGLGKLVHEIEKRTWKRMPLKSFTSYA